MINRILTQDHKDAFLGAVSVGAGFCAVVAAVVPWVVGVVKLGALVAGWVN